MGLALFFNHRKGLCGERCKFRKPWVSMVVEMFNYFKEQCQPERTKRFWFSLQTCILALLPGLAQIVIKYERKIGSLFPFHSSSFW